MTSKSMASRLLLCVLLAAGTLVAKPATKKATASKSATPPKNVAVVMELSAARALPALSKKAKVAVLAIRAQLEKGEQAQAKAAFAAFIRSEKPSEAKALATARWLVRTALLDKNTKLADAADRARFQADQYRELRAHLFELRTLRTKETAPFLIKQLILTPAYSPGAVAFRYATTATSLTLAQLDALIASLESQRDAISEATQLMELKLQDMMSKQQQLVQMMSALAKSMHDTARTILANIKS